MSEMVQQESSGRFGAYMARMFGAGLWGLALGVLGLWVLVEPGLPGFLGGLSRVDRVLVGTGMLAGGQLVFLLFVAERIFVRTPKRLRVGSHWILLGIGGLCFVLFVGGQLNSGVAR